MDILHSQLLILCFICSNQLLDCFDANLNCAGGILGHGHEHTGLLTLLVPNNMEARTAANAQSICHHEQSRRLHFAGLDAQTLPAFPLVEQLVVYGALLGAVLAVESILTLDNTGVGVVTHLLTGSLQSQCDLEVCNCGILNAFLQPVWHW